MCRCCQSCLEDLYWSCIEEKFCYDESIAQYNPDEDEYYDKKKRNGFLVSPVENNNGAICIQPSNYNRNCSLSSKIHEEDYYREIQTNIPILAPEIMAVFANSQIFQEHQPKGMKNTKIDSTLANVHKPIKKISESVKLLEMLEKGENDEGSC